MHVVNEVRTGSAIQLSCTCSAIFYVGPPGPHAEAAEALHIRTALNPSVAQRDAEWRVAHPHVARGNHRGFWRGFTLGALLGWLMENH